VHLATSAPCRFKPVRPDVSAATISFGLYFQACSGSKIARLVLSPVVMTQHFLLSRAALSLRWAKVMQMSDTEVEHVSSGCIGRIPTANRSPRIVAARLVMSVAR
jgi:hypothetical protein